MPQLNDPEPRIERKPPERRGPEYVAAKVVQARTQKRSLTVRWWMVGILAVVLVGIVLYRWLPGSFRNSKLNNILAAMDEPYEIHTVVISGGRQEKIREEWRIKSGAKFLSRVQLFNDELVGVHTDANDFFYEAGTDVNTVRLFDGGVITSPYDVRSIVKHAMDPTSHAKIEFLPAEDLGNVEHELVRIEYPTVRYDLNCRRDNHRVDRFTIKPFTESGWLEADVDVDLTFEDRPIAHSQDDFSTDLPRGSQVKTIDHRVRPNYTAIPPLKTFTVGKEQFQVLAMQPNTRGGVFFLIASSANGFVPPAQLTDSEGTTYISLASDPNQILGRDRGVSLTSLNFAPLDDDPRGFTPRVFTLTLLKNPPNAIVPRGNNLIGSVSLKADNPSCFLVPAWFFEPVMTDVAYLRYYEDLTFQRAEAYLRMERAVDSDAPVLPDELGGKNPPTIVKDFTDDQHRLTRVRDRQKAIDYSKQALSMLRDFPQILMPYSAAREWLNIYHARKELATLNNEATQLDLARSALKLAAQVQARDTLRIDDMTLAINSALETEGIKPPGRNGAMP